MLDGSFSNGLKSQKVSVPLGAGRLRQHAQRRGIPRGIPLLPAAGKCTLVTLTLSPKKKLLSASQFQVCFSLFPSAVYHMGCFQPKHLFWTKKNNTKRLERIIFDQAIVGQDFSPPISINSRQHSLLICHTSNVPIYPPPAVSLVHLPLPPKSGQVPRSAERHRPMQRLPARVEERLAGSLPRRRSLAVHRAHLPA